jgi:FAD/FMN-containing dehydrogenase
MDTRLSKISRTRYTWFNTTRNVEVTPEKFFFPENKEDIALIIREAERRGLRVRAVGSGHSFSEAAKGHDFLLSMKHLDKVWLTKREAIKTKYRNLHLATAEAGTIIKKLTRILDKQHYGLINMGVIDVQTISGAMMTGTHGTGINKPAIPDMVRSLKLVGAKGEFLQIEPTDGITDPEKFDHKGEIQLIQDDDIFYSTILSFGGMGIVYEITLQVVPQYWMKEKRYLMPWSALKEELRNGNFMKKVNATDFVAFRVNPYEVKGDHRCAVVEQEIIPPDKKPTGLFAHMRNILSTVFGNLEYLIESSIEKFKKKPSTVGRTINTGLWATKKFIYFNKSHKVLYQCGSAVIRYGISSEFAFDARPEKIIQVIDAVIAKAKWNAEEAGLYQSSHVPVRFVPASDAYLSSAYCRETVYIDIPLLYGTTGDTEILESYQKMMIGLGGIPHWGKHNMQLYLNKEFIRKQFERVDDWIAVREKMDPQGTFLNDFIIKMGLSGTGSIRKKMTDERLQEQL